MKQLVGSLDSLYKLLERSSKHFENLEIIKLIRKVESGIKELEAKEATTMSIKKENLAGDIIKTHKTDNSFKCKDSCRVKLHISGPHTRFKCKVCDNTFT